MAKHDIFLIDGIIDDRIDKKIPSKDKGEVFSCLLLNRQSAPPVSTAQYHITSAKSRLFCNIRKQYVLKYLTSDSI